MKPPNPCSLCGLPNNYPLCASCIVHPCPYDSYDYLSIYQPPISHAIHQLKYRDRREFAIAFASLLWDFLQTKEYTPNLDFLVPVPMHALDIWRRGFNHCERILKELSLLSGIPTRKTLLKVRITPPQVSLTGLQRMKNLRGAFRLIPGQDIQGKNLLLFDDVYTTGTTLREAAKALQKGNPNAIYALTLARTL